LCYEIVLYKFILYLLVFAKFYVNFNKLDIKKISSKKKLVIYEDSKKTKEVVIWNTTYSLGNVLLNSKITNYIRYGTSMSKYHRSIFIGILLGDGHIRKIGLPKNNARVIFKQAMINFPYLWFVFIQLFSYCGSFPRLDVSNIGSKRHYLVVFGTRNYPFLNELYEIFIDNGKKRVPINIFHELTPVALAHWIMCDGGYQHKGLILCTDSFTIEDVVVLMNVLLIKYNITSSLHKAAGHPRIYISRTEIYKLKNIVIEYIIPFSKYKLGIKD